MRAAIALSIALALTACELVLDLRDDYVIAEPAGHGGASQSVTTGSSEGGNIGGSPGIGGGGANGCNVLVFDGQDDWVELPVEVAEYSAWRTLEAWVEWNVVAGGLRTLVTTQCGSLNATPSELLVNIDPECDGTDANYETQPDTFPYAILPRLVHIALVTHEGGELRFYVGGVQQESGAITPQNTGVVFGAAIGTRPESGTNYFFTSMKLYGLRISALDMYSGMTMFEPKFPLAIEPGVRATYTLEQTPSTTLEDATGNHDGTIRGPEWERAPCPP